MNKSVWSRRLLFRILWPGLISIALAGATCVTMERRTKVLTIMQTLLGRR